MTSSIASSSKPDSPAPFTYPPQYSFPPFYTLQPNLTTRASQLASWSSLLLSYCSHNRLFRIASTHSIFHNEQIRRKFASDDVRILFAHMRDAGRAEFVSSTANTGKGRGWIPGRQEEVNTGGDEIYVYWRTPEEWASLLIDWVEEAGQKGAVLTVFELTDGEMGRGKPWEGMPRDVVRKVLNGLVKKQRAVLFGEEEGLGVKFF